MPKHPDTDTFFNLLDCLAKSITISIGETADLDLPAGKRIDILDELILSKQHLDRARAAMMVIS